jgi:hypothetical protein
MKIVGIVRIVLFLFFVPKVFSQEIEDSTKNSASFYGSVGITNNGFSIVPTFSLNSPATIINLAWRKKKFSFEPDIRLVPNGSKGGMVFWLRYRPVETKKFSLRLGVHPAFSFIRKSITENNKTTEISELLRFAAVEVVPNYQITNNWSVGAMYLNGNGLQAHGPQHTNVLFLNTAFTNLKMGGDFRFSFIPIVYFLKVDDSRGDYFTATGIISHKKLPLSLLSTINKTFTSNIVGNQDFMWNILLNYNFSRTYKRVK